jgi:hypothetical protein
MGKRDDALHLLNSGLDPIQIAKRQGVSLLTILGYLDQMIGAGKLRRSDVLFSVDKNRRANPKTSEEHEIVRRYGSAGHALGDMYEDIRRVEVTLHARIRTSLEEKFGNHEEGWWGKGIPLLVRQKLQNRREEDDVKSEPYGYTDLLDLAEILDKNWGKIAENLFVPPYEKQKILSNLRTLNRIRRKVMHPVRSAPPEEQEFEFVRGTMLGLKKI